MCFNKKKLKYFSNKFNKKISFNICSPWVESFNKWNIQYFFKNKIKLKTSNSQKTVIFWAKMGCYVVDWSTKDKFEHFLKQY